MIKKPQLAEDAVLNKLQFPCWEQPKIDGVRALNINGTLTGRSLDPFKGTGITEYFSQPQFVGLDGEMILGNKPNCTERLCSATTGAMNRFNDVNEMPDLTWCVFDYLAQPELSYAERYLELQFKVDQLNHSRIKLVPYTICKNVDDVHVAIARNLNDGFEGTILRNPRSAYKPGRSTLEGQLWRVKPWADAEIQVTGITEGNINANEAKKNTLGRTERSSSAAGMIPNGQVGSIQGVMLADFYDPVTGKLLFPKGLPITVGSGEMTVKEAIYYFSHPNAIIGHIVKFKHMTHGVKNQPRFPTYMSHRLPQDMSS
jgi:DNA ligase-1